MDTLASAPNAVPLFSNAWASVPSAVLLSPAAWASLPIEIESFPVADVPPPFSSTLPIAMELVPSTLLFRPTRPELT
ncbi:hypothetical protein D3C81_2229720 [compost metagenome]